MYKRAKSEHTRLIIATGARFDVSEKLPVGAVIMITDRCVLLCGSLLPSDPDGSPLRTTARDSDPEGVHGW